MANPNPQKPPVHSQFGKGNNANPGGKPVGARNRITAHFLNALADHFAKHGKKAIELACEEDPVGYLKVIGALMPKQIEVTRPLEGLTDDELSAIAEQIRSALDSPGSGSGAQPSQEPSQVN
jgi:hypothetical protein